MKNETQPRIILGIPGTWKDRSEIVAAIASKSQGYLFAGMVIMDLATKKGFKLEIYEHDPQLQKAFSIAGGGRFDEETLKAIGSHTFALYLVEEGGSLDKAQEMMAVACGLLRAGGLAVKIESAGVAHTAQKWFELAGKGDTWSRYQAFVTLVGSRGTYYSCGMHNLGFRDAILTAPIVPNDAARLLQTFLLYLLFENPVLKNGETFSVDEDSPHYRLAEEPCTTYPADDPFHNPFGMWRLTPK